MVMACGVNYPYIHSNNFEMNRFFFLLIRFEVNQSSHLCYALPNLIRDWRYLMLPNWLFTEVAKAAQEQFKWGFPNAGDS